MALPTIEKMNRRVFLQMTAPLFLFLTELWKPKRLYSMAKTATLNQTDKKDQSSNKKTEIRVLIGKITRNNSNLTIGKDQVTHSGKTHPFRRSSSGKIYAGWKAMGSNPVVFGKENYSGKIMVLKTDEGYLLINQLNIEDYLLGVVSREVSPLWNPQALEAQSIAARSYAYHHYYINPQNTYHVKNNEYHQVFGGDLDKVKPSILQAVKKTDDKILTYRNSPVKTFFHACCGGMTEKAEEVWGSREKIKYFKNIRCPYCTDYPRYEWELEISDEEANKLLAKLNLGELKTIKIINRTYSKRVKSIEIKGSQGVTQISGQRLRSLLNNRKLFSTKFKIKKTKKGITFLGRGFGHGVGLCQAGSKKMGESGHATERILKFYYKSTALTTIARFEKKIKLKQSQSNPIT